MIAELPRDYAVVPLSSLNGKLASCPSSANYRVQLQPETDPYTQERQWLENCRESGTLNTWPAFHSQGVNAGLHKTRSAILPIFRDKSHDIAMMEHSMKIVTEATKLVNPSQVRN